jgi:hypothetical protein
MSNRKYILKPGTHQFVPGSQPVHHNENTSDEEIQWYLEKYPHIRDLLEAQPEQTVIRKNLNKRPRLFKAVKITPEHNQQINEDLSSAN